MKKLILALLLICLCAGGAMAQERYLENYTAIKLRGGYNSFTGGIFAATFNFDYACDEYFAFRFGEEYDFEDLSNTEIRPAYFYDFDFGRFTVEALGYVSFDKDVIGLAFGGGLGLNTKYAWVNVGYYHRTFYFEDDSISKEPFNIYYELGVRCLPTIESWDLDFVVTNSRLGDLERHYQPTLMLTGRCWLINDLGIELGVQYKPAGIFKKSSDIYQIVGTVGVSSRW